VSGERRPIMGMFTLKHPTSRVLQLVVEIKPEHSVQESKQKLSRITRELKRIIKRHELQAAKRRRAKKR
jgi:hypothetical protein